MRRYSLLLALTLTMTGCGGLTTTAPAVISEAPIAGNTTIDEKAWYAMEAAYNVPAQAYVTALNAGQLPGPVKALAKPILVKMNVARKAGRAAYKVGDARGFFNRLEELQSLKAEITPLIPGLGQ